MFRMSVFALLTCSSIWLVTRLPVLSFPIELETSELVEIQGSGGIFASSDCLTINAGMPCTSSSPMMPLNSFCPATVQTHQLCGSNFDFCPGTAPGGALNKACQGVFTYNPYNFTCYNAPAVTCDKKVAYCSPTGFCVHFSSTNPSGCGSRTDCVY
jgi:hypothetical protein